MESMDLEAGHSSGRGHERHRHCAFCLKSIEVEKVKFCGKCLRRAYCSQECQKNDWTLKANKDGPKGQGHKHWCGIDYCEEDLDWAVVPVQDKGLGVVALRNIPARSKIMVDATQPKPTSHVGIKDLFPENGSLEDKFLKNCIRSETDGGGQAVCLRIARVNHACFGNSSLSCFEGVKILVAQRDIAAGEEICRNYVWADEVEFTERSKFAIRQVMLYSGWKIVCPMGCFCRDYDVQSKLIKIKKLQVDVKTSASQRQIDKCLEMVNEMKSLQMETNCAWMNLEETNYYGFILSILRKQCLPMAEAFIEEALEISKSIYHPNDPDLQLYGYLVKDPSHHRNYLAFDNNALFTF